MCSTSIKNSLPGDYFSHLNFIFYFGKGVSHKKKVMVCLK